MNSPSCPVTTRPRPSSTAPEIRYSPLQRDKESIESLENPLHSRYLTNRCHPIHSALCSGCSRRNERGRPTV